MGMNDTDPRIETTVLFQWNDEAWLFEGGMQVRRAEIHDVMSKRYLDMLSNNEQ